MKTSNTESTSDYLSKLQKQVPYMTLEVGSGLSMARGNKVNTLAVNPKLLEKMQNDPEKAKEYTQRLKDIENAQKFVDGYMKAKGSKTKFSHWYVDENGNYSHIAYYEHDNTFYKKLSEKSRENIEKHIEKTREKAAEKQKEFQEKLEEKQTEQEDGTAAPNKAGISKQTGTSISGGVKYKHSNQYYNEDGVPFHSKEEADRCIKGTNGNWKKIVSVSDEVKAELAEVVKQDFIAANGWLLLDAKKDAWFTIYCSIRLYAVILVLSFFADYADCITSVPISSTSSIDNPVLLAISSKESFPIFISLSAVSLFAS